MKALVINLDSATERMAFQTTQLNNFNIHFQRLPAYKINDNQDQIYQTYYNTWQRPLSVSEVSCFFSHKSAWDIIVTENQPMLILEDDAWLADNVPCILEKLEELSDIEYVTLEVTGSNRKKLLNITSSQEICESKLLRLFQGRSGAGGYVLWPAGAKKLLAQFNKGKIGLADKFINACYSIKAYQVEPAVIIQLDQCHYHDIQPPLKVKTSISTKANITIKPLDQLRYRCRRVLGEILVGLNLLKHKKNTIRRKIELSNKFNKL